MRAIYAALLCAWLGVASSDLSASPIAFDTAGDSAYNNFDPNSMLYPNGGYGWGGPWENDGGLFVNEPGVTGLGHPADTTPINSPMTPDGRAWGISYPIGFEQINLAQRPLAGALRAIAFGLPGRFIIILCLRPSDHSATVSPVDAKLRGFASNFAF